MRVYRDRRGSRWTGLRSSSDGTAAAWPPHTAGLPCAFEGVRLQIEMLVGGSYAGIADQHAAFPAPTGRDAAALPEQYYRIGLHQNMTAPLGKEAQIMTGVLPWE